MNILKKRKVDRRLNLRELDADVRCKPIVIDIGSYWCRAGFAGQDLTTTVQPAVVGKPKHDEILVGVDDIDRYFGEEALSKRGNLRLVHPVERGVITHLEDLEVCWKHTFYNDMRVNPEDHPIFLTEPVLNSKANRERMIQIMFESFVVPSMYIKNQAVLALHASGKASGVVLDSGYGKTQVVCVYQGYILPLSIESIDIAGEDLTSYLMKLLTERGYSFTTSVDRNLAMDIKEKFCYVAPDFDTEMTLSEESSEVERSFELPTGDITVIGNERFRCPEALFQPGSLGMDLRGVQSILFNSIMRAKPDIRPTFYANIVLSGGNTLFEGFKERLKIEISSFAPTGTLIEVCSPPHRGFSAWKGASVMASLNNFSTLCIKKEEYDEFGPEIVHKKCL